MKTYFSAVFLALLLVSACSSDQPKDPKGLYSRQKIASVMKDLYILEAKVKELGIPQDSAKVIFKIYEKRIFDKHHVNDSIYKKSFEHYLNDPQALNDIYTILADTLSLEERLNSASDKAQTE